VPLVECLTHAAGGTNEDACLPIITKSLQGRTKALDENLNRKLELLGGPTENVPRERDL